MPQSIAHTNPAIKAIIDQYKEHISAYEAASKDKDYIAIANLLDANLIVVALARSEINQLPEGAIFIHSFKEAKTQVNVFLGRQDSIWQLYIIE